MLLQRSQILGLRLPVVLVVLGAIAGIVVLFFLGVRFGRPGLEAIKGLPAVIFPPQLEEEIEEPEKAIEEIEEQVAEVLEVEREEKYVERAEEGEGITHLARRALREYLQANPQDFEVTPEHKVYIEDYLARAMGGHWLGLGEEVEFSQDLIKEAIERSAQLTDQQLENLRQYSQLVPGLVY